MNFHSQRVGSTFARTVKNSLLGLLGLQAIVAVVLTCIDRWRKLTRSRRASRRRGAARLGPRSATIGSDEITTYTYGEDLYTDMLTAIREARSRVLFETFIWKSDGVGQAFKDELVRAAERGVEVYVIFDEFANLVVPGRFKQFPPSVHVLEYPAFAPGWRFLDVRRYGRDHRKILVVDDETAFVGGYNVGALYATDWRDTHVRMSGPSTWGLKNAFVDFWNLNRGDTRPRLDDEGSRDWEARIRVQRNIPRQLVFPIRGMYLEAIDRATSHILMTHAYFIPDSTILRGVLVAARRGVDVRLLLPATSNHVVADWLSRGFYSALLRGGVRVFLYQDAMVHAKTTTIDGRWSTVGTANVDRLSLTGNYEINVEFYDAGLAKQMEETFAADCDNAVELTLEEWSRRSFVAKFSETVLAPLRPLL